MYVIKKYVPLIIISTIVLLIIYFTQSKGEDNSVANDEDVFEHFYEVKDETEEELIDEQHTQIIVDVKGEVKNPGVYEVDPYLRVVDVIEIAGGLSDDAADTLINLAEKIYDEMIVFVPNKNDDEQISYSAQPSIATSSSNAGSDLDKVIVNKATIEDLIKLNGIGPSKAQAIIDYREENGRFTSVEDLLEVTGIGEKTLENIREHIIIP